MYIGIVLDDLKWAVRTQFRAHYNASHPIVMKTIRRNITENYIYDDVRVLNSNYSYDVAKNIPGSTYYNDLLTNEESMILSSKNVLQNSNNKGIVTHDEFSKKVPRYPNDGVLLIDVKKYNARNILSYIDRIAAANAREYVVGV